MKLKIVKTKALFGLVTPPSSKSHSIRGLILALLSNGQSELINILDSEDTETAIAACKNLGAEITAHENKKNTLNLISSGLPLKTNVDLIYTGNSGITTRFVMPLLGLRQDTEKPIVLNCGEQMRARPIRSLVNALTQLGLKIIYLDQEGMLPVSITGKLVGGIAEVDGITSQYLSALLLSLPCASQDSKITVKNLHERPYVDMTLNLLNKHNIQYTHNIINNADVFTIKANQAYKHFKVAIPGDFSSASYLIAAAVLLEGCVELMGLDFTDPQGDKRLVNILKEMGADITRENTRLIIRGGKELNGIKIDANDIPDLLPTLAVIGTQAMGKTEICNVKQARIKETDRIHSMTEGLKILGAKIDEHPDGLTIYKSKLKGAQLKGYGDHRTVMALSIAGLLATGYTVIDDAEAINKTYPDYIQHMNSIGAKMKLQKHIILLGFKNAGKSVIGEALANQLGKPFIDLDKKIEELYQLEFFEKLSCREIMLKHGENYFRELEHTALTLITHLDPSVISLGGGTPSHEKNHFYLKNNHLIYITAPRSKIYKRIQDSGQPAYFSKQDDLYENFNALFAEREKIYKKLTNNIFNNNGSIEKITSEILLSLGEE